MVTVFLYRYLVLFRPWCTYRLVLLYLVVLLELYTWFLFLVPPVPARIIRMCMRCGFFLND